MSICYGMLFSSSTTMTWTFCICAAVAASCRNLTELCSANTPHLQMLQYCFATGSLWHCNWAGKRGQTKGIGMVHTGFAPTWTASWIQETILCLGNFAPGFGLCTRAFVKGRMGRTGPVGDYPLPSESSHSKGKHITAPCFHGMCLRYIFLRHCAAGLACSIAQVWILMWIAMLGLSFTVT